MLVASIRRTGARVSIRLLPEIYTAAAKLIKEHLDDRRISIRPVPIVEFIAEENVNHEDASVGLIGLNTEDLSLAVDHLHKFYEVGLVGLFVGGGNRQSLTCELPLTTYASTGTVRTLVGLVGAMILKYLWCESDEWHEDESNIESCRLVTHRNLKVEVVKKRMKGLALHEQWRIGFLPRPQILTSASLATSVSWLPCPKDGVFTADPFIIFRNGEPWVVYEELGRNGVGRICMIPSSGKSFDESVTLLDTGYHLSYPYVFDYDGSQMVMPEASEARTTSLYRFIEGDLQLRKHCELLPGLPLVDPTLLQYDGLWWLFATVAGMAENHALCLWTSESLEGTWQPHPQNPIKISSRSGRCAGTLFWEGDSLIRPSQDVRHRYGASVFLNRIEKLSTTSYSEHEVRQLQPDSSFPNRSGLHHIGISSGLLVFDALRDHVSMNQISRVIGRH